MSKQSAGLLVYRRTAAGLNVLLVHPGGPFWARKDDGAWSIPKGLIEAGEEPLAAARREFQEETGLTAPPGVARPLSPLRQAGGKVVHAWAVEADLDLSAFRSTTFTMEWPPKSGKMREFPEADRIAWFVLASARQKILKGQAGFLDQIERL